MLLLLFFGAMCAKFMLYGFVYYPVLDDFIQYGGYPQYHDPAYVWLTIGTLSARPFAGLLDPTLWGAMWPAMGFALCILTLLHFAAGLLLQKTLKENGYRMSPLFLLIFLLFPLGMEGAYWISASTRTVVGIFFAALSFYCLTKHLKTGKWLAFALYALFFVLASGFYEAALAFAFLGAGLVIANHWKTAKHRWPAVAVPLLSAAAFFAYYQIFAGLGAMGSRAAGFSLSGLLGRIADLFSQLFYILTAGSFNVTVKGFGGGIKALLSGGFWGILCLVFIALLAACIGWYAFRWRKRKQPQAGRTDQALETAEATGQMDSGSTEAGARNGEPAAGAKRKRKAFSEKKELLLFLAGAVLFFGPLVPNLLVSDVWLTYRSLFIPLCGLAMMAEPVFWWIFRSGTARGVLIGVLAVLFMAANVNEYATYREVSSRDTELAESVAYALDDSVLTGEREAVVLLERDPVIDQASYYKDHVKSVFCADWSLTGAVRAIRGEMGIKRVTPVLPGEAYEPDGRQVLVLDGWGRVYEAEQDNNMGG